MPKEKKPYTNMHKAPTSLPMLVFITFMLLILTISTIVRMVENGVELWYVVQAVVMSFAFVASAYQLYRRWQKERNP